MTEVADSSVPVYQWHCLVPCLTTRSSSVRSLHPSSSLDSGILSNSTSCFTYNIDMTVFMVNCLHGTAFMRVYWLHLMNVAQRQLAANVCIKPVGFSGLSCLADPPVASCVPYLYSQ